MAKDPVESSFSTSNVSILLTIVLEFSVLGLFQLWDLISLNAMCGLGLLLFLVTIILFILAIALAVQMFSASKYDKKHNGSWVGGGVVIIIGLVSLFVGMPFYPFMIVIGLYIVVFPYLHDNGKSLFVASIMIYLIGLAGAFIVIFLRGVVHDIIYLGLGGFFLLLLLISHSIHIYLNKLAISQWRRIKPDRNLDPRGHIPKQTGAGWNRSQTGNVVPPEYSAWKEPVIEIREPAVEPVVKVREPVTQPFMDIGDPGKEPVMGHRKPRELRPPPGFSIPADNN